MIQGSAVHHDYAVLGELVMNVFPSVLNERRQPPFVDLIQTPTNNRRSTGLAKFSSAFQRIALLEGLFLSAVVADRFGIWGAYEYPNVAWDSYPRFVAYTAKLLWLLPPTIVPALAFGATAAETLFGLLLVLGWKTRLTSLLSGVFDLVAAELVRRYVTERLWAQIRARTSCAILRVSLRLGTGIEN